MTHMLHLVKIEDGDYLTFRVECPGGDDRTCKMYVDGESGCRCSDVNCPCNDGDDEEQDHWACRHFAHIHWLTGPGCMHELEPGCGAQHWLDETSPADCIHGDLVGPGPWPIDVEWRDEWDQFIIRAEADIMRLVHYSDDPVVKVRRPDHPFPDHHKPRRLWVSDEDDFGWSQWTADESYGLGAIAHDVTLADDANILVIDTERGLREFNAEYGMDGRFCHQVRWSAIAVRYDGIIITPYRWQQRYDIELSWYYPWDCASGCIWNPSAIASIVMADDAATDVVATRRR